MSMDSFSGSRKRRSRKWADVPIELLGLILDRLALLPDFIRFGAVCKPWSLATKLAYNSRLYSHQELPMLLVTVDDDRKRLYSIWENKFYPIQIPYATIYWGSGYGWLAFFEKNDVSVTLLNPFSGTTIPLPAVMKTTYYLEKVILSCDPCLYPDDWVVVVFHSDCDDLMPKLSFIRSGEDSWNIHPWEDEFQMLDYYCRLVDICFYQGKMYMVNRRYDHLVAIDFSQPKEKEEEGWTKGINISNKSVSKIEIKFPHCNYWLPSYLVEFEGNLLLVYRIQDSELIIPRFRVWKLSDSGNTTAKWIDIDELGKFSLFLGDNNDSVAIYDSSNIVNFQPNCIYYYTDVDLCTYNLVTQKHNILEPSQKYMEPTLWISPTLGRTLLSQD